MRSSTYGARDIADRLGSLAASGQEVGLHGIDAWIDSTRGQKELEEIAEITGATDIGVRMHWLYFDEQSPATLEKAGFSYDSTVGYNETIGYRAGTTQVFKPLTVQRLLELPLHIMDTALFYPIHLNLSFPDAQRLIDNVMIDGACQFGGVVTLNWHDRSRAPERLWGEFYADLIRTFKLKGAWCATARDTVSWFRSRRSVAFERAGERGTSIRIKKVAGLTAGVPGLRLRAYNNGAKGYTDCSLSEPSAMLQDLIGTA
jgi:hypothetical protein